MSDQESDLKYSIYVLRGMINQLPDLISKPMEDQLDVVSKNIQSEFNEIASKLRAGLEDATLAVKSLEFDLACTKRERDTLKERLGE